MVILKRIYSTKDVEHHNAVYTQLISIIKIPVWILLYWKIGYIRHIFRQSRQWVYAVVTNWSSFNYGDT